MTSESLGHKAVLSCLVSGSGIIRARKCYILEYESQIEETVGGMGSGLIGLHMKDTSLRTSLL